MFLGIDIGTSAVKTALIDEEGRVAAQASAPVETSRPLPLWSEQDPDGWWRATVAAVRALPSGSRQAVRAVGLSGQMHGATFVRRDGRALRPAMLWNDGRAHVECGELERDQPRLRAITGNRAMAGFTAPKVLWVARHEPAVLEATWTVLLPKDFVRHRLSGDFATDLSDASGTLWLDVGARSWSPGLVAACGLDPSRMPMLHEGSSITGTVAASAAEELGIPRVPVAAGAGDQAAGAVGSGVIAPGQGSVALGTSGVVFVADDAFRPNPDQGVHAFCHALPGRWHRMSVMLSAASCLDWVARVVGAASVADALAAAEGSGAARPTPLFLPYLSGERTPHADPHAQGAFVGITHDTTAASLVHAVLDGVAMGLRDGLDALLQGGGDVGDLSVIGGGSRSTYWARLLAAALGRPITIRVGSDVGPALGAARLARLAVTCDRAEEVCAPLDAVTSIDPDPALAARYAALQPRFRALYASVRPLFQDEVPR